MTKEDIHGLAATIRTATISETFDLGGLPATTISQVVRDAFSREFDLDDGVMIRITLVVGAGKGNRTKYDPAALKLVTASLRDAGYAEDRASSCVVESAGCFKFQHDTGKNLKTVVVFPKIIEGKEGNSEALLSSSSSLLPPNSLEFKIAVSTVTLFSNMLKHKFPSWSQKRSLLQLIDEVLATPLDNLDAKLMRGGLLSESESKFYEQCVSVSEKKSLTKDAMSLQVKEGQLTALEVSFLSEQVASRVEELQSANKVIPNTLQERQAKLKSIAKNPISPSPLKHHAALGKLWKQAAPLMYLNRSGGKLLSPTETKKRGQLDDILSEIAELEESSRGLLEDDESYEERIQSYRRELQQKYGNIGSENAGKNQKRTLQKSILPSNKKNGAWNSTTKFVTPSPRGGAGWKLNKTKKSKNRGERGVFGAYSAGSVSDSDSDSEQDPGDRVDTSPDFDNSHDPHSLSSDAGVTKSGKSKKKKKKKSKRRQIDDDTLLDAAVAANNKASKNETDGKEEQNSVIVLNTITFLLSVIKEFIVPLIMAMIMWFVGILFGNSQKKRKKS